MTEDASSPASRPAPLLPRPQGGSALIEALVAILLFAIGIIALVRVLGAAVTNSGDVQFRSVAANVADTTIGRMWVDRSNLASYAVTGASVPELPNGSQTVAVNGNTVTVTINWQPPGADAARTHTVTATLVGN